MPRYTSWLIAFVLIPNLGCGDGLLDNASVNLTVRTDKSTYSLASDQSARAVLVNRGPGTVYVQISGEYVVVEKFERGKWRDPTPWFTADGIGLSRPIHPGDSIIGWPMSFGYIGRRPGTYRFRFFVFVDAEARRLAPSTKTASPAFEVRP